MNKFYLMLLWPPAVFFTYPPLHAGGSLSSEKPEAKSYTDANNSVSSPRSEDQEEYVVKRTDIKKLMETGVAATVTTKVNGRKAVCDICGEPAEHFWASCEVGCVWSRCDKHRNSNT